MSDLLLYFAKPFILATLDLCQLYNTLKSAFFPAPHQGLAMNDCGGRLILASSLDEGDGNVAQTTARWRRGLPEVSEHQDIEAAKWSRNFRLISLRKDQIPHHSTQFHVYQRQQL